MNSVRHFVWYSVRDSVMDSTLDSVEGYIISNVWDIWKPARNSSSDFVWSSIRSVSNRITDSLNKI